MRKIQQKTHEDLLVAANLSKSARSMERLLQAEKLARKMLASRHDEELANSFRNAVGRLVRWLDEPFPTQLTESLIISHVRGTTNDLSGKRIKNHVDLTCPVCGMRFTDDDVRKSQRVTRVCQRYGGKLVAKFRCRQCESLWEDTYQLKSRKIVGRPTQRVIFDGRF